VRLLSEHEDIAHKPNGATAATVYTLDSTNFLAEDILQRCHWGDIPVSFDFRLLADVTPVKGYDAAGEPIIAEFSDLAEASDGVKWLGVLRMDVDSLGNIFKQGFKQGSDDYATISRMSTLSESLRMFFEGWVPQLCGQYNHFKQGNQDRLYLIYAGGDDLFVVGAWSVLPELAQQLRADLRKFVGGDHITLSGGIAIEHQKFPLYQLANDAKHALDDQAKEFTRQHGGRAKDALCFLQTPMGWEHFEEVRQWQEKLRSMLKPTGAGTALPHSFLTRLTEIHALYIDNTARQQTLHRRGAITLDQLQEMIQYDKWQWRLVYQLSRFGERYKEHQDTIKELGQTLVREQEGLMPILHVLARWTALLTREE
jgi:CRISPR-associated protein Csm1